MRGEDQRFGGDEREGARGTALTTTPALAADDAHLSVLHAVPGLTVDVYVNGKRTLNDFKPGMMAGPLKLKAGTYSVAITKGDAKDDSDPAMAPSTSSWWRAATTLPSRT